MSNPISITRDELYEMVYKAANNIINELHSGVEMDDDYIRKYDEPARKEREDYDISQGNDVLDDLAKDWLTHRKEDEDEDFPRIKPYQSAEQERNGEWDEYATPGTYPHIRGFMKRHGTSVEDVEAFIGKAVKKYGEPVWTNKDFRENYPRIWEKSKFARLYKEYVDKYRLKSFGHLSRFPYESGLDQLNYFGKIN